MADEPATPAPAPAMGAPTPAAGPPAATPPTPPAPPQHPTAATPTPGDPGQLGDAGKRALDAERAARRDAEAKLKEYEPLVAKARELEEAQKTETQKLTEQLQAMSGERDTASTELAQLKAALAAAPAGMDGPTVLSMAARLRGSTPEELAADAAAFFQQVGQPAAPVQQPAPVPGNGQTTPVEQLRPGALPAPQPASLADQIAQAEAKGDWKTAMQLKSQLPRSTAKK